MLIKEVVCLVTDGGDVGKRSRYVGQKSLRINSGSARGIASPAFTSPRRRARGERFSRLRSSGRVSEQGTANRGTHFSRPHLQGAVGMWMNCQVRARVMLRRNCFGCRRTEARNAEFGADDLVEAPALRAGSRFRPRSDPQARRCSPALTPSQAGHTIIRSVRTAAGRPPPRGEPARPG